MKKLKVLNLYSGIGGNRKLWEDVEVTAIELNLEIAKIYQDFFPDDKVIVTDAHEYLLKHFKEFDFIWSSPPCQSHTRLNTASFPSNTKKYCFPDLKLYEEIIFLKHWFKGKYIIENVIPYYNPLIIAQKIDRHLFWANFKIIGLRITDKKESHKKAQVVYLEKYLGFDLKNYTGENKRQILRNCINPELGNHLLNCARNIITKQNEKQIELF